MQKIRTFLSFDNQAEDAAKFYVSIFKNSEIVNVSRYGDGLRMDEGGVLAVDFKLEGQEYVALNCGPMFKFTPAMSLLVDCATPEEVDELWSKLSAVPEAEGCGWCQDKYGVTWQIVPTLMSELTRDKDSKKANAILQAMSSMKKIDSRVLQEAYDRA
ncbi:MAG TPA: VOC family protein [Chloroflexota bacterium]|nr:VOC family protein [Chloroflexota bacterium]